MSESNLSTLSQLEDALEAPGGPGPRNSVQQFIAADFEEYLEGFYAVMDRHIEYLTTGPQFLQRDHVGEDRVTFFLIGQLRASGFAVSRDERAGSPDMVLEWQGHSWIGEAKIYKGPAYVLEGWLQLTTRYSTGTTRQCNGGILCYYYGENALSASRDWQAKLTEVEDGINISGCRLDALAFRTSHPHRKSGLPFNVRHSFVLLSHDPQDKSGRG